MALLLCWCLAASSSPGRAQAAAYDFSVLRINEVIASNNSQAPADKTGKYRDMVEIYNGGEQTLPLGASTLKDSLGLSAKAEPTELDIWTFPSGGASNIPPKSFLVVFFDQRPQGSALCELYSSFGLKNDGTEPITLWGPQEADGKRKIIDQVWPPPLPDDVSFGRYPDGAGPAPVPLEETLSVFHYSPPGKSSFGTCQACTVPQVLAACRGGANGPGGNLPPRIAHVESSTNHPALGEAVSFRVRVRDDKDPTPPNIARVLIRYSVNGQAQPDIPMTYDSSKGILTGATVTPPQPLDRWTEWVGEIPGQPAGSGVDFTFFAEDAEGLSTTEPEKLCDPGVGPCDREFGGPGCQHDLTDVTCSNPPVTGARYIACSVPYGYVSGYTPRPEIAGVVINEVVPRQDGLLEDVTQPPCRAGDCPKPAPPNCCKLQEDFLELYNGAATAADLSGLWLSAKPFHPEGWQFPPGSSIGPGEYLIVWLDKDGGKCPDPKLANPPCFWECPDPTDPTKKEFHTSFGIDADGDAIYLFDKKGEHGFGFLNGLSFLSSEVNHSWSLIPNGDRNGCWVYTDSPTPRAANVGTCPGTEPEFYRGDANGDCGANLTDSIFILNHLFQGGPTPPCMDAADVDDNTAIEITDAIYLLQFLFMGGPEPPPPGPSRLGVDSTPDELPKCTQTCS